MDKKIAFAVVIATGAVLSGAARAEATLPPGSGKDVVENVCTACHQLGRIVNSGYSPEGWRNVVSMMVNIGAPLSTEQSARVSDYLARNFPEKPRPAAVVIPGRVDVAIKEWNVPTPGSRPHDPLATPDGAIWYSGQMANVLGRLDPKTGRINEYKLPPNSGPHGIILGPDGKIWYTANFGAYIGKLDPKTGDVVKYAMPNPKARDPHTLKFDQHGILWFTVQGGNMLGRLDPKTGAIKLAESPTSKSNPYGLVINSKGVPFFDEFGAPKIGSIDPETMQVHEYVLNDAEARPRRIAITADDTIWYTDYTRGYLGRIEFFKPVASAPAKPYQVTEWPSPGGPKSQPYAITVIDDVIWYVETGVKPNALVRFDPKSHSFQSWVIPSGGGVVRNMMPTADGHGLALACSGVNKIALVTIR